MKKIEAIARTFGRSKDSERTPRVGINFSLLDFPSSTLIRRIHHESQCSCLAPHTRPPEGGKEDNNGSCTAARVILKTMYAM